MIKLQLDLKLGLQSELGSLLRFVVRLLVEGFQGNELVLILGVVRKDNRPTSAYSKSLLLRTNVARLARRYRCWHWWSRESSTTLLDLMGWKHHVVCVLCEILLLMVVDLVLLILILLVVMVVKRRRHSGAAVLEATRRGHVAGVARMRLLLTVLILIRRCWCSETLSSRVVVVMLLLPVNFGDGSHAHTI